MVLAAIEIVLSRKKDNCTVIWNGVCSVHKPHERLTLHTAVIETRITAPVLTHTIRVSLQVLGQGEQNE